jgi:hypothetical protein
VEGRDPLADLGIAPKKTLSCKTAARQRAESLPHHSRAMDVNRPGLSTVTRRASKLPLLNLGTVVCFLAWLAFACYALAYLVSH